MATTSIEPRPAAPERRLSLFDSTSIIVGIIIGSGIYETSPRIAAAVPGPGWLLAIWFVGGLFALVGALCYAELATAFPASGGDYVYLTRAFGRRVGFLFAWAELCVVRPGSIGAMAFVFARYADRLFPFGPYAPLAYAAGSVAVLSAVNLAGIVSGKWTQNILATAKTAGLLGVVAIGMLFEAPDAPPSSAQPESAADWVLAMIYILWAYGGWNEMAYVGAEVRDPQKNIVRALLLGTGAVTLIYVLVNAAFLHALGFEGTRTAETVAADVAELGLGRWAGRVIGILICISALGAINGMIFTGSRIFYALGTEHRLFGLLGTWSVGRGAPTWSIVVQGAITLAVVIGFGALNSESGADGFERMVIFGLPIFWFFLLLVGISLICLRWSEPHRARPFRVPAYPLTPLILCASTAFMLYASLDFAWDHKSVEAAWAIGLVAIGAALSWLDRRQPPRLDGSEPRSTLPRPPDQEPGLLP